MASNVSIEMAAQVAARNYQISTLDRLRDEARIKLCAAPDETVVEAFDALCFIDMNAAAMSASTPINVQWGFAHYDARFLRDLRNQKLGAGQAKKDLSAAQVRVVRGILSRDPSLTLVALLGLAYPITD